MTKIQRRIGIGLAVFFFAFLSAEMVWGCSGKIKANVNYRYEWDRASGGTVFKDGQGTWKGTVEVFHVWDILEDSPFSMTMDLDVNSNVPYIGKGAKSWLVFWCSSMVQETELKVEKIKVFCTGYPYFPYDGEIFYLVPLSFNGSLIPVLYQKETPEGRIEMDLYFQLKGRIKGLSQGVLFLNAEVEGRIDPGWDE